MKNLVQLILCLLLALTFLPSMECKRRRRMKRSLKKRKSDFERTLNKEQKDRFVNYYTACPRYKFLHPTLQFLSADSAQKCGELDGVTQATMNGVFLICCKPYLYESQFGPCPSPYLQSFYRPNVVVNSDFKKPPKMRNILFDQTRNLDAFCIDGQRIYTYRAIIEDKSSMKFCCE